MSPNSLAGTTILMVQGTRAPTELVVVQVAISDMAARIVVLAALQTVMQSRNAA